MKNSRTLDALFVAFIVLSPGSTAALVLGQGGTGRETPTTPPKRTTPARTPPSKKSTPTKGPSPANRSPAKPEPKPGTVVKNQIGMELVYVPSGTFTMGSDTGKADEKPAHRVTISEGFYIGRYEVTQAQWQTVMGSNPSNFKDCADCPVEQVSWDDAQEFVRQLNALNDGYTFRLPTEAEWEFACRAGTTTDFGFGNSLSSDQANFNGNSPYGGAAKGVFRQKTTAVGSFAPNAFGLYDMHGNVYEWCEDRYHETYAGAPTDARAWLSGEHQYRVLRSGSWFLNASEVRSAERTSDSPSRRTLHVGLRVVAIARTK